MTLEVRIRPEAVRDLVDASTWYEEQRAILAEQFLEEVGTVLAAVAEAPLAPRYTERHGGL